jgi:beta-xylosidase
MRGGLGSRSVLTLGLLNAVSARSVTLSNLALPVDLQGEQVITGEASVLLHRGFYYFYFNNWGSCPGVDCCSSTTGCASCCFDDYAHYLPGCADKNNGSSPYGLYHTVQVYRTHDLAQWENLGTALPLTSRKPGIEFRPCVVYNAKADEFVMWYEDRGTGETGYSVATSPTPQGPFRTSHINVTLPGAGRIGDFSIFVDEDASAYHVRTGFDIVKLNAEFTGAAEHVASFTTPESSEGPTMFKRNGTYYITAGVVHSGR